MVESTTNSKQLQANTATADLPNLNNGLYAKPLSCSIHPSIVSNILDHYMRRPEKQQTVIGSLLGSIDGSKKVDIQTSFAVPYSQTQDKAQLVDFEYAEKMLKFQRKVNPKEGLIGLYKSGQDVDKDTIEIWYEYMNRLMTNSKTSLLPQPLLLLIDPTMKDNKLSIKVLSFVSAPEIRKSLVTTEQGDEEKKEQCHVFSECPYSITLKEFEKTGLDVIFYGQDHYDTMAIATSDAKLEYEDIPKLKEQQKLISNKDLMSKNFTEVIDNLTVCDQYI